MASQPGTPASVGIAGCDASSIPNVRRSGRPVSWKDQMQRILIVLSFLVVAPHAVAAGPATLYRSPECGCCLEYAAHLRAAGFDVDVVGIDDLAAIKVKYSVPDALQSCHTTVIGGYAIEGHVPLALVNRLLGEKPRIRGISLPGMPAGSPGMGGEKTERFVIYELDEQKIYALE